MDYFLGIPLPPPYAARIEAFRREITDWTLRPQRSEPHISVKSGAGLNDDSETAATVEEIVACTVPFTIQLREPAIFEREPVLYLSVVSPGWSALHRVLVDTFAARTGATMHPLERMAASMR
jgi:2'-5' RNA ligase